MDEDETIREFLEGRPEAAQLREWRETLEERLRRLKQECDPSERPPSLAAKIRQLEHQVVALREEEAITEFVEDSVRVTLAMGALDDASSEF